MRSRKPDDPVLGPRAGWRRSGVQDEQADGSGAVGVDRDLTIEVVTHG